MQKFEELPEIAEDAVTMGCGSDRYPGTVINEDKGIVTVQYDDDRVVSGSIADGSAEYSYHRNENGMIRHFRLGRNGRYEEIVQNALTGRWNKTGYTGGFCRGRRSRYYDPHF